MRRTEAHSIILNRMEIGEDFGQGVCQSGGLFAFTRQGSEVQILSQRTRKNRKKGRPLDGLSFLEMVNGLTSQRRRAMGLQAQCVKAVIGHAHVTTVQHEPKRDLTILCNPSTPLEDDYSRLPTRPQFSTSTFQERRMVQDRRKLTALCRYFGSDVLHCLV
jgi:hypothetical protein